MNKFFFLVFSFGLYFSTIAQVAFESSNLPIVIIDTEGREIVDEPKVFASLKIIDNGLGNINSVNNTPNDYDGYTGIELRGQSSQTFDKKSYGLELKTITEEDTSAAILGMPKEEDWVLYGPYSDKSLLRNVLSFHLWSKMERYGSRTRFCEVVINGDYKGLYVFMEKIKKDGDRVDIAGLNPDENSGDDLTGGYIFKIDKTNPNEFVKGWVSDFTPPRYTYNEQNIFFQVEYPKPEEISNEQLDYIQSYVEAFEQALADADFTDPVSGYRSLADVEAFIDYALLTEINKNVDGYRLSTFLYKDKDSNGGKLKIGPPWDYNLAFGNADYCEGGSTTRWAWDFNEVCDHDYWLTPFWWNRFLEDPVYVQQLKERWSELRASSFITDHIHAYIDSVALVLEDAQQRNFQRWPILGQYVWPNNFVGQTYKSEINYLKDWIEDRITWMDQAIDNLEVVTSIENPHDLISIFPNPTADKLRISSDEGMLTYQISDMQGKLVKTGHIAYSAKPVDIELYHLKPGVYMLRIGTKSKQTNFSFIKK